MTPIDPAILAKFVALPQFGKQPRIPGANKALFTGTDAEHVVFSVWQGKRDGFLAGYQLCAAEKQVEIDGLRTALQNCAAYKFETDVQALKARIATLERQRQHDREVLLSALTDCRNSLAYVVEQENTFKHLKINGAALRECRIKEATAIIDAARAKEPSHEV